MGRWVVTWVFLFYTWTVGQSAPTASAYLLLLSTGVTDLLMGLLQELLQLLTGLLFFNLLLPQ